jgi:hypothetical protein
MAMDRANALSVSTIGQHDRMNQQAEIADPNPHYGQRAP